MNLNKNFLTEVIKYLINRGVTLADVLDTFNEHFNTSDNAIKNEHENHDEVRKPITDLDLLLCGRSVEESSTPEKPEETKTETLETESNTEKATESVTNATELNGNNVTAVILDTPNLDAIRKDKDDKIEKALKKFVTHTEESKKPKETKSDLTVLEVCQKINVTTHELREMVNSGEFPQPDCDKKWSVKLLKKEGII